MRSNLHCEPMLVKHQNSDAQTFLLTHFQILHRNCVLFASLLAFHTSLLCPQFTEDNSLIVLGHHCAHRASGNGAIKSNEFRLNSPISLSFRQLFVAAVRPATMHRFVDVRINVKWRVFPWISLPRTCQIWILKTNLFQLKNVADENWIRIHFSHRFTTKKKKTNFSSTVFGNSQIDFECAVKGISSEEEKLQIISPKRLPQFGNGTRHLQTERYRKFSDTVHSSAAIATFTHNPHRSQ